MDWGDKAAWLETLAAETGTVLPALRDRIEPRPELCGIWDAFFELSTDRPIGMGLGPIPWTAINAFAGRYGITDDMGFELLLRGLRAMDAVFLDVMAQRAKQRAD